MTPSISVELYGIAIVFQVLCISSLTAHAQQDKVPPCREDAMIVFDASGFMSGNQTLGIPNSQARIDVVRSALAEVLPSITGYARWALSPLVPVLGTNAMFTLTSNRRQTRQPRL